MGLTGNLGIFLHSFLTDKEQTILANGVKSGLSNVKSGVLQGTVLGPILFLVMINDIDENIESEIALFCDDTRVMKAVNKESDVEALQDDLNRLYEWQEANNMLFNGKKFEILRYGKNEDLKNETNYFTPNFEDIIEEKDCLRDLGVLMSNTASFSNHVNQVCTKVNQKSGWILRTFRCRDTIFLKHMWKSLVQPHVDYCSQLYFPKPTDMEKVENLFRTYSKKIPELRSLNYWERLKCLKTYSQERRLERYRIIYVWKILRGLVPNCGLEFSERETRRGVECLIPPIQGNSKVKSLREQSFKVHGGRLFNSIPKNIRNMSGNLEDFKELLDKYLQTIPDEPKVESYTPSACDQITCKPSNSIIWQAKARNRNRGL